MAGDWIPFTKDLPSKPEVLIIAEATGRDRRVVACLLMEFWSWAEAQTEDGFLPGLSVRILSALHADIGGTFFGQMIAVGWLAERDGGIDIPHFDYWMGRSAKRRVRDTKRRKSSRGRSCGDGSGVSGPVPCPQSVRNLSACDADKPRTTEQNRTEKKNTPLPPNLDTVAFREAWTEWQAYRREIKKTMTPRTERTQLKELSSWGPDRAIKAITRSIAAGWTGIHEGTSNGTHRVGRDPSRVEAPAGKYDGIAKQTFGDPPPEPGGPAPAPDDDPAAGLFSPGFRVERDPGDF